MIYDVFLIPLRKGVGGCSGHWLCLDSGISYGTSPWPPSQGGLLILLQRLKERGNSWTFALADAANFVDGESGRELPAFYYLAVAPQLDVAMLGVEEHLVARTVGTNLIRADQCLAILHYGDASRVAARAFGGEGFGMLVARRVDVDVAVHEISCLCVHFHIVLQQVVVFHI